MKADSSDRMNPGSHVRYSCLDKAELNSQLRQTKSLQKDESRRVKQLEAKLTSHTIDEETHSDLVSIIEQQSFLFTVPGVKFFLSRRLCQDLIEKFFGCQRQRRRTHDNPNAQEFLQNTQALRVVNGFSRDVATGNCRGNKMDMQLGLKENTPLPKRKAILSMILFSRTFKLSSFFGLFLSPLCPQQHFPFTVGSVCYKFIFVSEQMRKTRQLANTMYRSLAKECLWVERLSSLPRKGVGVLSSVSAFNYERAPMYVLNRSVHLNPC